MPAALALKQSRRTSRSANPLTVVHMSSAHDADDIRIFEKECRTLAEAGYQVVFIVPAKQGGTVHGVRIEAVPIATSRWERFATTSLKILGKAIRLRGHVYHMHDPDLIPVGLVLKLLGRKVVFDAHEDLPDQVLSKPWIPRSLRPLVAFLSKVLVGLAGSMFDGIVAATPAIAERFPPAKTVTVQNFPINGELMKPSTVPYDHRPTYAIYMGGIAEIRGIREMVDAIGKLPVEVGANLVLAGTFSSKQLEQEITRTEEWQHVNMLGWQTRDALAEWLAQARVGLVLFHPVPNHVSAQPNKLFEYMSVGIPVIASDFPLWKALVEGVGCGLVVNPLNTSAVAEAIRYVLEHPKEAQEMGLRGQEAIRTRFNWEAEASHLLDFYDKEFAS